MKAVKLIAYEKIVGVEFEDLQNLNALFASPIEYFESSLTDTQICEYLEKKYAVNISKLFNPIIRLEFIAT